MMILTPTLTLALVLLAAVSLCAAPATAQSAEVAKGFLTKTVKVGRKDIRYVVFLPPSYDPNAPAPAIVFLNGAGECGTDGLKQIMVGIGSAIMVNVEKWPFIVVFPQKQDVKHVWEDEDPMVMGTIDAARREYNIDPSRIYLTGLSQGGHGTWAIAARHPDLFAALAPICGWGDEETAKKVAKLPIWVFHGDQDTAVNVDRAREMARWIEAAGGTCKLSIYEGVGHNSWDKAYREEELGEWFLAHARGAGNQVIGYRL
jgi:predicted peptidase